MEFFKDIRKERTIKESLLYYLVFFVASFALFIIALYFGKAGGIYAEQGIEMSSPIVLMLFVLGLAALFVGILIVHGFFKLFKGKGNYTDTFKTVVYSFTPSLIFSLIQYFVLIFVDFTQVMALNIAFGLISLILWIWVIVLITVGGSALHRISRGRAFLAGVLVPAVVITIIALIIFFIVGIAFFPTQFAAA